MALPFLAVGGQASSSTAKVAVPTTGGSTSPRTFAVRVGPFGARSFEVGGVRLAGGDWLTVALHPNEKAVRVRVVSKQPTEVCPASVDGAIGPGMSSWPSWFHFDACQSVDSLGEATLPPTDGSVHVAFGVRALRADVTTPLDVSVSYEAEDSFVVVIPPAVTATHADVTFRPHTATVGVHAYVMPDFGKTSIVAVAAQQNRRLRRTMPCDFGSEIGCVGRVQPNVPARVTISGPSSDTARLAVYLSWV
jgi:hypothetical protein